jgi:biopolymer transport protein TolR
MTHMHQSGARRRPMSEINVVPFIDVMLVLLVIFMITAPLLTQGVKVELPKTQAKALTEQEKEPLIVTVDSSGNFYFNLADKPNQPITARTLSHLVTDQLKGQENAAQQRPVLVRGDKNVNYGKVMEAMSLLQQAGAKSVGLITHPLTPEKS